jgi:hypothetical protein
MHFDNKRLLLPSNSEDKYALIDSLPLTNKEEGENLRYIGKIKTKKKTKQFCKYSNNAGVETKYKKVEDLAIISFIKGLIHEPPLFNLNRCGLLKNREIVNYIKAFDSKSKVNESSIASLKKRSIKT